MCGTNQPWRTDPSKPKLISISPIMYGVNGPKPSTGMRILICTSCFAKAIIGDRNTPEYRELCSSLTERLRVLYNEMSDAAIADADAKRLGSLEAE
jgi:hypothetical protein